MIIDSHMHFGSFEPYHMSPQTVIASMDKYGIDFGIISNIEGCEFRTDLRAVSRSSSNCQLKVNERTLELIAAYPHRLKSQFWVKPYFEPFTAEFADFYLSNRGHFGGLKFHPYHSQTKITDVRCKPYLDFASEYGLSVAVHSAKDEMSDPRHVYEVAQEYPGVNFIMVHMGMYTDHKLAMELISRLPNLYGDTSWVPWNDVLSAIQICGSPKILFGSDSPVKGIDTYLNSAEILAQGESALSQFELTDLMCGNSVKMFELSLS